jgi:hypothetical protein
MMSCPPSKPGRDVETSDGGASSEHATKSVDATLPGKPSLEFSLLTTPAGALLALPVPFPSGWRTRGILDGSGTAWTVDDDGLPVRT